MILIITIVIIVVFITRVYFVIFSVQELGNHFLPKNAETGCEMEDANLEGTASFCMDHSASQSREQRAYEVLFAVMSKGTEGSYSRMACTTGNPWWL